MKNLTFFFNAQQIYTELDEILGMPIEDDEQAKLELSYSSVGGPDSELDHWLYFMEGQNESWINKKSDEKKISLSKIKIIISDDETKSEVLSAVALTFWRFVLTKYEVYLWDNKKNIHNCVPIKDLEQFLVKRNQLTVENKLEVEKILAAQGQAVEEYRVLDHDVLADIWKKIIPDTNNFELHKDLPGKALNFRTIPSSVDAINIIANERNRAAIKEIWLDMTHVKDLKLIRQKYPNATFIFEPTGLPEFEYVLSRIGDETNINFKLIGTNWNVMQLDKPLSELSLDNCAGSELHLYQLKSLKCNSPRLANVYLHQPQVLEQLHTGSGTTALNLPKLKTDAANAELLISLSNYIGSYQLFQLITPFLAKNNRLNSLTLFDHGSDMSIKLPSCTTLKDLTIINCNKIEINVKDLSSLQNLTISNQDPWNRDLSVVSTIPNLETLTIIARSENGYNAKVKDEVFDANIKSQTLKTLMLKNFLNVKFDNIDCPKLETLILSDIEGLTDFSVLPYFPKLKKVTINNTSELYPLSFCINLSNSQVEKFSMGVKYFLNSRTLSIKADNCHKLQELELINLTVKQNDLTRQNLPALRHFKGLSYLKNFPLSIWTPQRSGSFLHVIQQCIAADKEATEWKAKFIRHLPGMVIDDKALKMFLAGFNNVVKFSAGNTSILYLQLTVDNFNRLPIDMSHTELLSLKITIDQQQNNTDPEKVIDLLPLTELKYLRLKNERESDPYTIKNLPTSLELLDIELTPNVLELDLSQCKNLKYLHIAKAPKLKKLIFPVDAKHLETIIIFDSCELDIKYQSTVIKHFEVSNIASADVDFSDSAIRSLHIASVNGSIRMVPGKEVKLVDHAIVNLKNAKELTRLTFLPNKGKIENLKDAVNIHSATVVHPEILDELPEYCSKTIFNLQAISGQQSESEKNFHLKLQQELALDTLNRNRQIAVLNLNNVSKPDGMTKQTHSTYQASGDYIFSVINQSNIKHNHYRVQIVNSVEFKNGEISFIAKNKKLIPTKFSARKLTKDRLDKQLIEWLSDSHKKQTHSIARLKGRFMPGEVYPLASEELILTDEDVEIISKKKISILKDEKTKQYFFRLEQGTALQELELFYAVKKNPQFSLLPDYAPIIADPNDELLPQEAINFYIAKINALPKEHPVAQLFNLQDQPSEFLRALIAYCDETAFKGDELSKIPKKTADILWQVILEQKGACRHRSEAFFLLARLARIPVNMMRNHIHQMVEIPYSVGNSEFSYHYKDLGGARTYDVTPAARYQEFNKGLPTIHPPSMNTLPSVNNAKLDELGAEGKEWAYKYYKTFVDILEQDKLYSFEQLDSRKRELQPLLEVKTNQDIPQLTANLIASLRDQGKSYIYINSPKDFKLFLQPSCIKNGKKSFVAGPLEQIITHGGNIIVNWNNFNAKEAASFKSILDKKSTLFEKELSPEVRIFNIISKDNHLVADAVSRCVKWQVQDSLLTKQTTIAAMQTDITPFEVNLFNSHKWREMLYGQIKSVGKQRELIPGILLKAIEEKRPLVIYNPPEGDADFNTLLFRIREERRLLFNGEMKDISPECIVSTQKKEYVTKLANVTVDCDTQGKNKIYLQLNNLKLLNETNIIDNQTRSAKSNGLGLLDTYDEKNDCFYLTQSLPTSEWALVLEKIKTHYPNKNFHFVLAPSTQITEVLANNASIVPMELPPETKNTDVNFIMSNDSDYFSQTIYQALLQQNIPCHLFEIGHYTNSNEILYKISNDNDGFEIIDSKILQLLRQGETVILNGEISHGLYLQLLPLLAKPPTLFYNGKLEKIPGRLICVTGNHLSYTPTECAEIRYDFNSYRDQFSKDSKYTKDDLLLLDKINQFHQLVLKLPHAGSGRPLPLTMTHHRLIRFIDRLKYGKLHPNNPIKGLLLYDYPYKSNDYHFMNVVAKCLFVNNSRDEKPIELQYAKLAKVIAKYKIKTNKDIHDHIWEILNCFSGKWLQERLDADLSQLELLGSYPSVKENVIECLAHEIINFKTPTVEKIPLSDKPFLQLQTLLQDPSQWLIFLKGEPGTGKSYSIERIKNEYTIHASLDQIKDFLTAKEGKHLLLLDEGNMELPGILDFLRGIRNNTVYYDGKEYTLKPNQKIIITGNPESFTGRYYHSLFQNYAETIYFKAMTDDELADLLYPELGSSYQQYARDLLQAYKLIPQYQPHFTYSIRDLKNLAKRFIFLLQAVKTSNGEQHKLLLHQACSAEFAGMIADQKQREAFIQELATRFEIKVTKTDDEHPQLLGVTKNLELSSMKMYLYQAIEQDLNMREHLRADRRHEGHYKQCILLEGDVGIGKSTLFRKILKSRGFSKDAQDFSKRFYQITAGGQEAYDILRKAFHEGAVVILDELNIDPNLENLLNQLLTGKDESKRPATNPGFMVLATQNPSTLKGRGPVSHALRNRVHFIYMDNDNREEELLTASSKRKPIYHPKSFDFATQRIKSVYPDATKRSWWTALRKHRKEFQLFFGGSNSNSKNNNNFNVNMDLELNKVNEPQKRKPVMELKRESKKTAH